MDTNEQNHARLARSLELVDPTDPESVRDLLRELAPFGADVDAIAPLVADCEAEIARAGKLSAELLRRVADIVNALAAMAAPAPSRGEATIELFAGFIEEAEQGLAQVEEILLASEQSGIDRSQVDTLFRVFHTIKGVAGCLEIGDIVRLAHATETMLGKVREGSAQLDRARIDIVFDANTEMRSLIAAVRKAVETGTAVPHFSNVDPICLRIEALGRPAEAPPISVPMGTPSMVAPPPRLSKYAPAFELPKPPPPPPPPSVAPAAPAAPVEGKQENAPAARVESKLRETVKVDVERIDGVVDMIGELIIVEAMVVNAPEVASIASLKVRNCLSQLTKISRDLQDVAMRMRMVPVRGVFQRMAKMVRELARKTGKDVTLAVAGETVEMDRSMVERIEDPLVHMIRNAVDHGIEDAQAREKSGKTAKSTVRLSAYHEGGSIVVELADDGKGLDREKILNKARAQGLVRDGEALTDSEVFALIFLPGFSTASQVTELSGRGVGMDVVKKAIEGLRGRVTVTSKPGQGTTFRLVLPLTLAIIDGMLVSCGGERYIVPSLAIVESLKTTRDQVRTMADRGELVSVRGDVYPLVRAHRLLGTAGEERPIEEGHVIVVESLGRRLGLFVDEVLTQQQVVIKPLGAGLGDTGFLSGAAILSDGRVGLIVNVERLGELLREGMAA